MSAPAARSAALKVERSRVGCSALILDFLPIFAKNVSIGMAASAVATGACPVATYKYKAAGRIAKPTRTPSKNLAVEFNRSHLVEIVNTRAKAHRHIPVRQFRLMYR